MNFTVVVGFDEAGRRYHVISSDVPGLHIETETLEEFIDIFHDVMPELVGSKAAGAKVGFEREIALA